jgi:hypothetical protein
MDIEQAHSDAPGEGRTDGLNRLLRATLGDIRNGEKSWHVIYVSDWAVSMAAWPSGGATGAPPQRAATVRGDSAATAANPRSERSPLV